MNMRKRKRVYLSRIFSEYHWSGDEPIMYLVHPTRVPKGWVLATRGRNK